MNEHNKSDYITLAEAATHSPYSQEYLSLRARQGSLKAVKQGRNWVTTLGWLDDYLDRVDRSRAELKAEHIIKVVVEPDKEFAFHPMAKAHQTKDEKSDMANIGSITEEDSIAPTGKQFAWEVVEPTRHASDRWLDSRLSAPPQYTSNDSYIDLGFKQDEADHEEPAAIAQDIQPPRTRSHSLDAIQAFVRPAMAVAVMVLLISTAIIFEGPLHLTQNIAAGTGVVLENVGDGLIAAGQYRESLRGQSHIQLAIQRPAVLADTAYDPTTSTYASAEQSQVSTGRVAGITTTKQELGFWATVGLGLKVFIRGYP